MRIPSPSPPEYSVAPGRLIYARSRVPPPGLCRQNASQAPSQRQTPVPHPQYPRAPVQAPVLPHNPLRPARAMQATRAFSPSLQTPTVSPIPAYAPARTKFEAGTGPPCKFLQRRKTSLWRPFTAQNRTHIYSLLRRLAARPQSRLCPFDPQQCGPTIRELCPCESVFYTRPKTGLFVGKYCTNGPLCFILLACTTNHQHAYAQCSATRNTHLSLGFVVCC